MPTIPTVTDLLGPLQSALYARLSGDGVLAGMLGAQAGTRPLNGVYDGAPEGAPFPYITIGEVVETPRNAHGELGSETVVVLHVWTRQRGYAEGLRIAARLRALLDHQPFTVTGHTVVAVRHEQTLTLQDPDPEIRHLPIRFRITTEQT